MPSNRHQNPQVVLSPRNKSASAALDQYGDYWRILEIRESIYFNDARGDWVLLEATHEQLTLTEVKDSRQWVQKTFDPYFAIIPIN